YIPMDQDFFACRRSYLLMRYRIVLQLFVLIALSFSGTYRAAAETKNAFPNPTLDSPLSAGKTERTVVLAGGCFWGMQAVFEHLRGVTHVTAGYSGGSRETARYEAVSTGDTGHAESVKIAYDPSKISLGT